ncbi:L-seryl-tRNA(Sec) selenium transferase, partial [Actinoplanes sp. NPDC051633]
LRAADNPTWDALRADPDELRARAISLASALTAAGIDAAVTACAAVVGGGGAPGVELPSFAVSLPSGYALPLRRGEPPVVGRVDEGRLLLDLRCVPPARDEQLAAAVRAV